MAAVAQILKIEKKVNYTFEAPKPYLSAETNRI
jgi:hypothetical protein